MSDVYKAPDSQLTEAQEVGDYGSIEKALAGDYHFAIGDTISEAWARTKGRKGPILLGLLIVAVISIALSFVQELIIGALFLGGTDAGMSIAALSFGFILQLVVSAVTIPFGVGVAMMGIHASVDEPVEPGMVLRYFSKLVPLVITYFLMTLMILLGFILLILPGIYLAVSYMQAMPLVVEKGLSPWRAMETSRKAITKKWFTVFFYGIVIALIVGFSALLLLIPLIWTVPMAIIGSGIMYRNMFGVSVER